MVDLQSIIAGLFGGFGALAVWEGYLKPIRIQKRIADVLYIEIDQNLRRTVRAHLVFQRTGKRSIDLTLSCLGFNAVASQISELPKEAIDCCIVTYNRFMYLNNLSETWQRWELQRSLATDPDAHAKLTSLIDASKNGYAKTSEAAMDSASEALIQLHTLADRSDAPPRDRSDYLARVSKEMSKTLDGH